jgi:hypothetical protein
MFDRRSRSGYFAYLATGPGGYMPFTSHKFRSPTNRSFICDLYWLTEYGTGGHGCECVLDFVNACIACDNNIGLILQMTSFGAYLRVHTPSGMNVEGVGSLKEVACSSFRIEILIRAKCPLGRWQPLGSIGL